MSLIDSSFGRTVSKLNTK